MIRILLEKSKDGLLKSCSAQGHAGYAPKGFDIVCAAVSCLLRTVLAQLEKSRSIVLDTKSFDRGNLAFSVIEFGKDDEFLLKYAQDFLVTGLSFVMQDYPSCVEVRVIDL